MRNEMKSDLLSNIEISEEMKRDIYRGCRRGKTTSDFRFRHSGALMAALIIGAVAFTGAGASAATFLDGAAHASRLLPKRFAYRSCQSTTMVQLLPDSKGPS